MSIRKAGLFGIDLSIDIRTNIENSKWLVQEKLTSKSGKKACDFLWYGLFINWDGGLSPCCYTYKEEDDFGNFFTPGSSFREIWNNAKFVAARSIFSEMRLGSEQDIVCNKCYVAKDFIRAKT